MPNYVGEYGEYCDAGQMPVTVIRSIDTAVNQTRTSRVPTMSYIIDRHFH